MTVGALLVGLLLSAGSAPDCAQPIDESLRKALRAQELAQVHACLAAGAAVDTRTERGKTVLMAAAAGGDLRLIERLLSTGVEVDQRNEFGGTPLMYAAARGQIPAAKLLLRRGASPNLISTTGWSALTVAAAKGQADLLALMLRFGADPNPRDIRGWSPLMHAAANAYPAAVEVLVSSPALRLDPADAEGVTALHCAVAGGSSAIVRLLLEHGADRQARTRSGETAVDLAARLGRSSILALLQAYEGRRSEHQAPDPDEPV
ncbi:MAG: ankyrin repeat domain-containing protein [Chromatiales bacterium]|jgi:hypothetical protein